MIFGIKDQARVPHLLHYVGSTAFDMLIDLIRLTLSLAVTMI